MTGWENQATQLDGYTLKRNARSTQSTKQTLFERCSFHAWKGPTPSRADAINPRRPSRRICICRLRQPSENGSLEHDRVFSAAFCDPRREGSKKVRCSHLCRIVNVKRRKVEMDGGVGNRKERDHCR